MSTDQPAQASTANGGIPLSSLKVGECARVCRLNDLNPFCHRLTDLGFVTGSWVRVRRRSPFRDPIEYEVRNTRICLRRSEAQCILVCDVRSIDVAVSLPTQPEPLPWASI